ncbi:MAG: ornithine cyclodeaminase family protein [Alphaproteobacteria bacterium]|nr:ornithine cyclodeaminase family protein [Alphaproteobacteria bacterium]
MLNFDAQQIKLALPWLDLIEALRQQFILGCEMPQRHHHQFNIPNEQAGTLLLMPAWQEGAYMGVKMVSVVPDNGTRNLPAIHGLYILSSAKMGENLALLDGAELTARRTAAASALAAGYLAREDASELLIVGAGKLSLNLIEAHCAIRPIKQVKIWARRTAQAEQLARLAQAHGFNAVAVEDLESAARKADIISCCTLSKQALIKGAWLKAGAHLDLIGAYTPDMRESDDECVRSASIFVDTKVGALKEGGDIVQPIAAGVIAATDIKADLYQLCRGEVAGRKTDSEITLFKSVGCALEDLAAAILAYENFK